jgi:hypothetical protein
MMVYPILLVLICKTLCTNEFAMNDVIFQGIESKKGCIYVDAKKRFNHMKKIASDRDVPYFVPFLPDATRFRRVSKEDDPNEGVRR